jgi:hypothetical protein
MARAESMSSSDSTDPAAVTATSLAGGKARAARAKSRLESTPPERATTTPSSAAMRASAMFILSRTRSMG